MIHINILSHKGGVGKSTIALALARALTELHYNVLLIDADYNHSLSNIIGIPNSITHYITQQKNSFSKDIKIDDHILRATRAYIDPPTFINDITNCDVECEERFNEVFDKLLKDIDIVIEDRPTSFPVDKFTELEINYFKNRCKLTKSYNIFVSDFITHSLYTLDVFIDNIQKYETEHINAVPLAIIINLLPDETAYRDIEKLVNKIAQKYGIAHVFYIPFSTDLYLYNGMYTPYEIKTIATMLLTELTPELHA